MTARIMSLAASFSAGTGRGARNIGRHVEGIAALEFAMLAPLMIYTICVAFDIGTGLLISRRLTNAVDVVAQLVSQQTSSDGKVTSTMTNSLLMGDFFSVVASFPNVLSDAASQNDEPWQYDIQIIASQVEFGPENDGKYPDCNVPPAADLIITPVAPPKCSIASVIWSAGFTAHQTQYQIGWTGTSGSTRQCGVGPGILTQTKQDIASPGLTTLPNTVYLPGDVIVVDLLYTYRPMFTRWITGSYTFERAAYITPRFFSRLSYVPPGGVPTGPPVVTPYVDSNTGISSCLYSGNSGTLP